jgi:hypothetical protein
MFTVYTPFSDTTKSAQCLDDDLLWQQLHDVALLCQAIAEDLPGRSKLLAVRQWRGYEGYLANYTHRMQIEAQRRDLGVWEDEWQTSPYAQVWKVLRTAQFNPASRPPRWIGGHWFLASQRSNLIRLNPAHYAHQFPAVPLDMPLLYPQNHPEGRFDYTVAVSRRDRELYRSGERVIPFPYDGQVAMKGLSL